MAAFAFRGEFVADAFRGATLHADKHDDVTVTDSGVANSRRGGESLRCCLVLTFHGGVRTPNLAWSVASREPSSRKVDRPGRTVFLPVHTALRGARWTSCDFAAFDAT